MEDRAPATGVDKIVRIGLTAGNCYENCRRPPQNGAEGKVWERWKNLILSWESRILLLDLLSSW